MSRREYAFRLSVVQDTCYHCPFAHPGLCEALDMDEYHSVCYEHNSFQFSPLAPPQERVTNGEWDVITANRIEGVTHETTYPLIMITEFYITPRPLWGACSCSGWKRYACGFKTAPERNHCTSVGDHCMQCWMHGGGCIGQDQRP